MKRYIAIGSLLLLASIVSGQVEIAGAWKALQGFLLATIAEPSSPSAGFVHLYVDTSDGHVKRKNSSGTVGVAYSQQLAASGGIAPYTWDRSAGVDCGGLSISSAGLVSGTPTTAQTCTPTYRATDSDTPTPQTASRQFSITIGAAPAGGGGTGTGVAGASVGGGRVN